ncbi:hypothetical protein BGZ49_009333 [Haplosporangium sp. Z 27]|nr:hypothetical protein BGZ49_009333 [Haplosporangium sp. Z 27]
MARLCQQAQQQDHQSNSSKSSSSKSKLIITMALSCMNQYELRRAAQEWKAIVIHIDPECTALQHAISTNQTSSYWWNSIQAIIWSTLLAVVGSRQQKIIRNYSWPNSRIGSISLSFLGLVLAGSFALKTTRLLRSIHQGYDVVKIENKEASTNHFFLIRRDFKKKRDIQTAPMYLLSGLGLGTIFMGARIAFKIKRV